MIQNVMEQMEGYAFYGSKYTLTLNVQFPLYPFLQEQLKDPSLLVHMAFISQS
jgi:hypothetical protein